MLIFRRWKVALPLLMVTIGMTGYVAFTAKPSYTMTSYVQFIPARLDTTNPSSATMRNPWNQLGLGTLGQASIYKTQDQEFLDSLKASGHTQDFTLTMTYPNPIVTVEVVGNTPADARDSTQLVVDRLQGSAEQLQRASGVGTADLIATKRLDQGQNLVPTNSKVKRAIIAVAAAGLVMTAGGTVAFDALVRRRARKRKRRDEPASVESGSPPTESPAATNGSEPAFPAPGEDATRRIVVAPRTPEGRRTSALRGAPSDSSERTAVIRRSSLVVKGASAKRRPATYRSANAQNPAGGQHGTAGDDRQGSAGETNGKAPADPSDVRVVLQPKWVAGENGGESK